jgi:hypothetical protein
LIYSFKNEIHSSCFNFRENINTHNTRGVKKKTTFHQHAKAGTAEDSALPPLRARVQLPMCACAQQSNTTPLELRSAQFHTKIFVSFA